MATPDNKTKLLQVWSQLNLKESWLFTHIANTILDTKIPVMNGTKDQKTTLRTEISWLVDNFKALHNLNARFRPGIEKQQTAGDLFALLARVDSTAQASNATIKSMAGALAAVTKGEAFDEAKLLASIQTMLDEQAERVVKVQVDVEAPVPSAQRALVQADPATVAPEAEVV